MGRVGNSKGDGKQGRIVRYYREPKVWIQSRVIGTLRALRKPALLCLAVEVSALQCAGLDASADDFHGEIETGFLEVNHHFHGIEFRLGNRIQCGIRPLKIERLRMFWGPLIRPGIELTGLRVS